jgi:hypothetical protein
MRNTVIAGVLFFSMFTLTGCENKQAKATRLEKVANDLEAQYRKECFDPNKPEGADAVSNALRGTPPSAQDKAAAAQRDRDEQARIASPHCQDLKTKKTAAGQEWAAALNAASSQ